MPGPAPVRVRCLFNDAPPGRLALHRNPENPVNPSLVASTMTLEPFEHIGI